MMVSEEGIRSLYENNVIANLKKKHREQHFLGQSQPHNMKSAGVVVLQQI